MSSACNNIMLDSQDVISKVVCAMCNECLISVNHDKCLRNYVNDKNSCGKKQKAKVSVKEIQKKYQPKVKTPKKVGTLERLATPKPRKPRFLLRKKQKSISSTKSSSKLEAEITSSSYGFVWTNENCQYKWKVSPVIIIRTDNDTEFKNKVLKEYFDTVGISYQMSSVRTPQQNGVVERQNRTLVEAARTMLIFSRAPLFLWAEAIATARFTQNHSIIHRRFNKTPYELINGKKPDISFLHVFGALCYPKNDREDIGKLGAKGDIGFFIGYSTDSCAYRVFNHQTKKIMETMNVSFDEVSAMAFEQRSSKPGLQSMTSGQISSGLDLTYAPSTITTQQPTEGELDLLFEAMYDDYIGGQPSATARTVSPVLEPQDHPLEQVIGEPSRPVLTRNQLRSNGDMCMYALTVSAMEPKNVKEAMTDPAWIDSMQEELLQFKRLDV
nr:retrovirus-related Pol polyprotein from transposon TNT 1-94 [Tanacetum cinerariifolium]